MADQSQAQSWTVFLEDATATYTLGKTLGRSLAVGSVILLSGDLGSGKTTLVQGLGAALGITEPIVSPTFALIHEYPEGIPPLYHLDLYRLDPAEVAALHLESYWQDVDFPLGIVAIEWPDRLSDPPDQYLNIQLIYQETGRLAELCPVGGLTLSSEFQGL